MTRRIVKLRINGDDHEVAVKSWDTLLEVLREEIGLTGTKNSCGLGNCGACTVIIDGQAVLACLTLTVEAEGKEILTIEGISDGNSLHPIQKAFIEHGAIQCGHCTPGMVMATMALLDKTPKPTEEEIRKGLSGNFCRCTGYVKVIDAVSSLSSEVSKMPDSTDKH